MYNLIIYIKLHGSDTSSFTITLFLRSDNDLQEYTDTDFETLLQNGLDIQLLASSDGYSL